MITLKHELFKPNYPIGQLSLQVLFYSIKNG
jgi:hypothetical protein